MLRIITSNTLQRIRTASVTRRNRCDLWIGLAGLSVVELISTNPPRVRCRFEFNFLCSSDTSAKNICN